MQSVMIDAASVKRSVTDVWAVLHALSLADGAKRQARGAMIRCLRHAERSASCSITIGPDGTLRLFCFGCNWSGDLFSLVAADQGLDERRDFPAIVQATAACLGLDGAAPRPPAPRRPPPPRQPPPLAEVAALWASCGPVSDDSALCLQLLNRALDPAVIADRDLARALPPTGSLPRWAWHNGQSWRDSRHILIVPLYDAVGSLRSVHARSLQPSADPKGLSPAGHSSAELVMCCPFARELLAKGVPAWWRLSQAPTVIIAEGVPDFMTDASHYGEAEYVPATIAVISGAWSRKVAARIPEGCRVVIRTHSDQAGLKYRRQIAESLCERCQVEVMRHG